MATTFRHYNDETAGCSEDYERVRAFLLAEQRTDFSYGRWDWMITHSLLQVDAIGRIGLWETNDIPGGMATFDVELGQGYIVVHRGQEELKPEMFRYAARSFADAQGNYAAMIPDTDRELQQIAKEEGFEPTAEGEEDLIFDVGDMTYALPEGYTLTDMEETFDLYEYGRVLHYGFDHGDEGPYELLPAAKQVLFSEFNRPHVDRRLKIAVKAPDGHFAAYCGMWYDPAVDFAIVEPVATDPAHRRRGLAKAAVLEGISRCMQKGAKRTFVGSSQRFYHNLGFRPHAKSTAWRKKRCETGTL